MEPSVQVSTLIVASAYAADGEIAKGVSEGIAAGIRDGVYALFMDHPYAVLMTLAAVYLANRYLKYRTKLKIAEKTVHPPGVSEELFGKVIDALNGNRDQTPPRRKRTKKAAKRARKPAALRIRSDDQSDGGT